MTTPHLYIARTLTDVAMASLADVGLPVVTGDEAPPERDRLLHDVAGAAAAVVTLTERVDAEFFDAAGPQLRVVANVAVGYDNIDVAEAARRGVVVTNTPGVLDDATADHTFAMILAVTRRVVEADRFVRSGEPWIWGPRMLVGLDLSAGATLGIVGLGRIGRAVARRAQAFSMTVLAHDPHYAPGDKVDGVTIASLDDLLATSDVVSLHVPLMEATRHLIDEAALARMKPTAYLINAARGGIVDESALIPALRDGRLGGAALDTFEGEPKVNPELATLENVVLQPHIASAGGRTRDRMCLLALDNVRDVLTGREARTAVIPR
ncbi:2-hydroxyacid dehydrogenase [Cellulomonas aerilata]|uniref:D-glycerate dehydrogenase n=1 Tax=Cellulomonas aerilata TaxID=515326 RepID=A0A512D764_9CELL|nr:D-glycerate dehydrogenase [Cellulomonas aerilata]GEO32323.1 D-glycerate dehydrogenase [Cellulomonas aerilata]